MQDTDLQETREWCDALAAVQQFAGPQRAEFILSKLLAFAQKRGISTGDVIGATPYCNTIAVDLEMEFPGDIEIEQKLEALVRWNAMAIVVRASKTKLDLGGHIGTFASIATLYEVGFNHFWHAPTAEHGGDLVFFQGHSTPGIYARSFLEGVFTEQQLDNFRREVAGNGISSYPHPYLMPKFWQFPTVSMGLGPLQAIYQARFMRYLEARNLAKTSNRRVWCFCGDGEMSEPESLGCLNVAASEGLDNLTFVINCNLQSLDGPVNGNGSIIPELENFFLGAKWQVIKVIWNGAWDKLFAIDKDGLILKRMADIVDGEYQNYAAFGPEYLRENFFGASKELQELIADWTNEDLAQLNRGGHDIKKVYAAYKMAIECTDKPQVILVKSVKGYGLGSAGEAQNIAHNVKSLNAEQLKEFRDRHNIPIKDQYIEKIPYYKPKDSSAELQYLQQRRSNLGGQLPQRRVTATEENLKVPSLEAFAMQLESTGTREISSTMAFVRILSTLCKDKNIGKRVVPIIPDEARTFGMEGMFRQLGIYRPNGQLYKPVDASQVMSYKETKNGQILQESLNEAGAFCSWLAAATSYSTHDTTMIPFYIYYSMFGFQRVGDLMWAAGDSQARGFLLGAVAGRTTLNGEGLQHQDGHSHVITNTIPNCVSYDPTFHYELAVIIQHGLERMITNKESVFFYLTIMNENYTHPKIPKGAEAGIIKGMYKFSKAKNTNAKHKVQLLGCGTILREVIEASQLLERDWNVAADVWSVTSFNELAREGTDIKRNNMLNPTAKPKVAYVTKCFEKTEGPVIATTDYIRQFAEQIRDFVPGNYNVLGTDGFGRSDSRAVLRDFFEVNQYYVVVAALKSLADLGEINNDQVAKAIKKYNLATTRSSLWQQ
ncbi:MAG: pyruvate dehydrogenase (acetyl-transferring), homodimeric type [Legionellales bacterium]|nr:MAG: pyruvate dehydrogenase (acetyl-transferring), homodimeric type [Legionellales bacterium]